MKLTRTVGLLAMIGMFASVPSMEVQAQIEPTAPTAEVTYDPIVSMLDSLVTLNHVVRFNSLDANCYDNKMAVPGSVPTFSEEVYKERMAKISSPIPLSYNQYVRGYIDLYANRKRGLTQRAMGLSNLYFPMMEEALDKEGLPLEFKYLSIVESALNPIAVSPVGATGIWQFMYATGLVYDLKVNSYTDQRRDPLKATYGACQYFKDMYRIYGDWLLVIAAYNCGAGNVNKAIKRSGGKTNFWEIMQYLPAETRGYVPAFIAVTYVMNYSREHNLYPVSPAYSYFQVDTIKVDKQINFHVLANQIDLPMDVISFLNPIYKKNYIPDTEEEYTLRLPTNKIALFMANQEQIYAMSEPAPRPVLPENFASRSRRSRDRDNDDEEVSASTSGIHYETITKRIKKTHTVKRGETLTEIADRYDMSTSEVKKLNKLRSSSVKRGQRLQVIAMVKTKVAVKDPAPAVAVKKDTGTTQVAAVTVEKTDTADQKLADQKADSSKEEQAVTITTQQDKRPKYVYHLVQPGDTLWNIAKRYDGVTVEMIKDINNLHNANIKPGTRLKVIVNG